MRGQDGQQFAPTEIARARPVQQQQRRSLTRHLYMPFDTARMHKLAPMCVRPLVTVIRPLHARIQAIKHGRSSAA